MHLHLEICSITVGLKLFYNANKKKVSLGGDVFVCSGQTIQKLSMPQKSEALGRKRNSYSLLAPWHWRKPWEAKGSQGPLHESNVCALRGIGDAAPHLLPLEDAKNSPRQVQHPHSVPLHA